MYESDVRIVVKLVSVFVLVLALFAVAIIILGDLNWCIENYAPDRVAHCMYYENNILGRYVQP